MSVKLIADSGATKAEWCLLEPGKRRKIVETQGISPYFLTATQVNELLLQELLPKLKGVEVTELDYYGTGCSNPAHVKMLKQVLKKLFPKAQVQVEHDLLGAAKAACGTDKGVVCILGTGSNSCYYNGRKIVKNSPGLGYVLGDEGSGAHLGKKVLQYYLYNTFDPDLMDRFQAKYQTDAVSILESVYKQPLPNRYLAGFTGFLVENRGHYMVENIIEDSFNDFIFHHLYKYKETWTLPIHFIGSVAFGFKDVLRDLCHAYELQTGQFLKKPMDGLIRFHTQAS